MWSTHERSIGNLHTWHCNTLCLFFSKCVCLKILKNTFLNVIVGELRAMKAEVKESMRFCV